MNTGNEWDEDGDGKGKVDNPEYSDTSDEEAGDEGGITVKKAIRIGRRMSAAGLDRTSSYVDDRPEAEKAS